MKTLEVHQKENSEDTERHLQENIDSYEIDAVFLYKLMLRGERLTAKTVVQKYGKESRRLRDLFISGKCEKEWVVNDKGKRLYVEYFVSIPRPPTKSEVIANAERGMESLKKAEKVLVTVFSLPDDPPIEKQIKQKKYSVPSNQQPFI